MMKQKYKFIFPILIIICFISSCNIEPISKSVSDGFWNFVIKQWDKEEQKREEKIANGEIVHGKDTILIWENMYVIGHYYDSNHLDIEADGISDVILKKVKKHKVKKEKLYILSEEGYAVIDKNNLCRAFITVPKEDFVNGYSVDEQGNKSYYTRYVENEHIQYLSEFNEYSDEEQKIFNRLKQ